MKSVSIIVAMGTNRVIGNENKLLWSLPADMAWFKKHTLGKTVIMGRKTFESIGKPLKGRNNIILTKDKDYKVEGATVVNSIEAVFNIINSIYEEVMVIGGAEIYKLFLPHTDRIYLTTVESSFAGDTYFPELHNVGSLAGKLVDGEYQTYTQNHFNLVMQTCRDSDTENKYSMRFAIYER